MTKSAFAVREQGQSIWLDQIQRGMLASGEFQRLVAEDGVAGVTSNPTIFEKAITGSSDYDDALPALVSEGLSADEIFDRLACADLQQAADFLRPYHDQTGGTDGFVSWEVSPALANDAERTLADARRLWGLLDRPNAMIKLPGTRAGLIAIEQALYEGININITLLFAVERYEQVMAAYFSALERRQAEGKPLDRLRSVASFFVSRVDTLVDKQLTERIERAAPADRAALEALRSKAAIANAKVAYQRFVETFAGPRWQRLQAAGAAVQRPLWASTSTKDPRLPDTYYVDALIGPHTVNTLPLPVITAFNDHGTVARTVDSGQAEARRTLDALAAAGIDMTAVTDQLEREGVTSFAGSFESLRQGIEQKRTALIESGAARTPSAARPS